MGSRLLIIKNPDSPLLGYLDLDRDSQEIFLIQDGANSETLKKRKNIKILADNASEAEYDGLLDSVLSADRVICV